MNDRFQKIVLLWCDSGCNDYMPLYHADNAIGEKLYFWSGYCKLIQYCWLQMFFFFTEPEWIIDTVNL